MSGSLNLILESHQPQTWEWDIYQAYEKDSGASLLGPNIGSEDRLVMKPKKRKDCNGREQHIEQRSTEGEGVGEGGGEKEGEREKERSLAKG